MGSYVYGKSNYFRDVGDVKAFIENGINGFVSATDNEIELTKNLKKLIEDPNLRDKLGKSAREEAKSKLDLKIYRLTL